MKRLIGFAVAALGMAGCYADYVPPPAYAPSVYVAPAPTYYGYGYGYARSYRAPLYAAPPPPAYYRSPAYRPYVAPTYVPAPPPAYRRF